MAASCASLFRMVARTCRTSEAAALDIAAGPRAEARGRPAGVAVEPARDRLLRQFHVGDQVLAADLVIGEQDLHAFLERVDVELAGQLVGIAVVERDRQVVPVDRLDLAFGFGGKAALESISAATTAPIRVRMIVLFFLASAQLAGERFSAGAKQSRNIAECVKT